MAGEPPTGRLSDDEVCIHPPIGGKCTPRDPDEAIAELARHQHGTVARRQLLSLGLSHRSIDGRLARGRLHRLHRGVYAVGHTALSMAGRWMAAVLASGPDAVLSHRAAGQLWGLMPRRSVYVEVTRPSHFRGSPGINAHRSTPAADETGLVDGIPVTSVSRTIFDLAAMLDRRRLELAMNQAEVLGLTDCVSIPELLRRYPRRRGAETLRTILREEGRLRGVTANHLEDRFAALVDAYDLPRPRFNADLDVGGRLLRPDALWRRERVIVELDGRATHGTTRAFESDRWRNRALLVDGWGVVRITWKQLRDEPAAVAVDLRRLLAGAAASTL